MIHIDWFVVLLAVSAFMVLALHGALWVAQVNEGGGERGARARTMAVRLYWPVCGLVLAAGVAFLSGQPDLAESFAARPELWVFPMIGTAGLLGMHFCLAARWNPGSLLCSAVFMGGLLCSAVMAGRMWGNSDKMGFTLHAETHSGSGRSTARSGIGANDSVERGL
jgi:cytochrome bd-type quinol oxidase subunit 2